MGETVESDRGARPKEDGEDSGKRRCTARLKKEKQIQAWYSGLAGDLQVSEVCLVPLQELLFARWVKEIALQMRGNLRFQTMTLLALQEAVEVYIVNQFDDANLCPIHGKCISVMPKHIQLA